MRAGLRAAAVGLLSAAAILSAALPALADVSVSSGGFDGAGDTAVVTVRVVNQRSAAELTELRVDVPAGIGPVTAGAQPGWTAETLPVADGPTTVVWTAATAPLTAGGYVDFTVLVGTLPTGSPIAFPTVETYSDGDQNRWGVAAPGQGVARPAPLLTVDGPVAAAATSTPTANTDGFARLLGIAALMLGLVGCGVAFQGSRDSSTTPPGGTMLGLPARLFPAEMSRPPGSRPDRPGPS